MVEYGVGCWRMYGRLLLALGYLSAPFAGPGSAVITAAGWLTYGSEARKPVYAWVGLAGLLGVAGILSGTHNPGLSSLAGAGGLLLMAYFALSIAMVWTLGVKTGNVPLKIAASLLAASFLLAVASSSSVSDAAVAASGSVVDWSGLSWANSAAHGLIESIGGGEALARVAAAAGAFFAALGFLSIGVRSEGALEEQQVFDVGLTA